MTLLVVAAQGATQSLALNARQIRDPRELVWLESPTLRFRPFALARQSFQVWTGNLGWRDGLQRDRMGWQRQFLTPRAKTVCWSQNDLVIAYAAASDPCHLKTSIRRSGHQRSYFQTAKLPL